MAGNWRKDKCYSQHGVDGSKCSFQKYLSEVEHFCPFLPSRAALNFQDRKEKKVRPVGIGLVKFNNFFPTL